METIHLTLDSKYVPNWGMKEGLRELIQNWLDAGGRGKPTHENGVLTLDNPDANMTREALIIGASTKAGKSDSRGEFGEGLKIGALALLRDGCDVTVHVAKEVWTAKLDIHPTLAREVLAWDIETIEDSYEGVRVEVFGLTGDDWASMRTMFRWGSDPTKSTIIHGEDSQGLVYVKGIYVMEHDGLTFGYDFHDLPTDRDRKLVDVYALGERAARVLMKAVEDGSVSGEDALRAFEGGQLEGQHWRSYNAKPATRQSLTDAWVSVKGDVIPCGRFDSEIASKLRKLNKIVEQVNDNLLGTLDVRNGRQVLRDLKDGRMPYEMTKHEKRNFEWALDITSRHSPYVIEVKVARLIDGVGLAYDDDEDCWYLSHIAVSSKTQALAQMCLSLKVSLPDVLDELLKSRDLVST